MSLSDIFDEVSLDPAATNYMRQATGALTPPWPTLRKLAEVTVQNHVLGVLGRRKKQQRGFYFDRAPGMHGVRAGFEAAAREAGKLAALRSFGLLHGKGDPVDGLTQLFRTSDFGLPRRQSIPDRGDQGRRAYNGGQL